MFQILGTQDDKAMSTNITNVKRSVAAVSCASSDVYSNRAQPLGKALSV